MIESTKTEITKFFRGLDQRVYRTSDLVKILSENRETWEGIADWNQNEFIDFLLENTDLRKVRLRSEHYAGENRYVWGDASEYEMALSLRRHSYLTHATAIFLHGLNNQIPAMVYVNHEQSVKPKGGRLTQEGINRAFKSPQRQSNLSFEYGKKKILVINGKNTGRLGVIDLVGPAKERLKVTNIERTLIDSSVRPAYAGGIFQVVEAFKQARKAVSVDRLVSTLKQLDYVYPYHQVIGFYMQRAEYDEASLSKMEELGIEFDFYATYGLKKTEHNKRWRLFYPHGI
jgi:hypothetical protein